MQNVFLDDRTVHDIDAHVATVLRDLGSPEPPLRLELVRELLQLDRGYYSSTDHGVLSETVHRLKVAGKQVLKRPWLLVDVVRKLELKALWLPDCKRILIDSDLPPAKQRWGEAHEIAHGLFPWHEAMLHGDPRRTLSLACQRRLEVEANYGAGRLLFLQDAFRSRLFAGPLSFRRIRELHREFGNTMTSTLWRAVETMEAPCFGLVGQHPNRPLDESTPAVRYFVGSRSFKESFPQISNVEVFSTLRSFCHGNRGPLGSDEVILRDLTGAQHVFFVETFFNHHEALTLGVHRRVHSPSVFVAASW